MQATTRDPSVPTSGDDEIVLRVQHGADRRQRALDHPVRQVARAAAEARVVTRGGRCAPAPRDREPIDGGTRDGHLQRTLRCVACGRRLRYDAHHGHRAKAGGDRPELPAVGESPVARFVRLSRSPVEVYGRALHADTVMRRLHELQRLLEFRRSYERVRSRSRYCACRFLLPYIPTTANRGIPVQLKVAGPATSNASTTVDVGAIPASSVVVGVRRSTDRYRQRPGPGHDGTRHHHLRRWFHAAECAGHAGRPETRGSQL